MALANYTDLRQAIADWLNRTDLTDFIPDYIRLAEGTLNRVMRNTRMVASGSITTSVLNVDAPTDMLEPLLLAVTSTGIPLEQVSPEQLIMLRRSRCRTAGTPRFYCVIGRKIELAPTPSGSTSMTLQYYQAIPPLESNATNWLLTYNPDLYLYTALMHAAPFLKDDARAALFSNFLTQQVQAAVQQNTTASFDLAKTPGFSLDTPSDPPRAQAIG